MEIRKDKYYIVRGDRSGVFFGRIKERNGREVTLADCRRIWYWEGAASLSQLAAEGTNKPGKCKFTVTVDELLVLDAIEIIPCTQAAEQSIKRVSVWRV